MFHSVAVDLFGPLKYRDMVKKRVTGKGWGVVFVCMHTSAVHLELTESYNADSFLMLLGAPLVEVFSDRGSQLVEAAKEVGEWDFQAIIRWGEFRKLQWNLVPIGALWQNRVAEYTEGMVKRVLEDTLKDKVCSFNEFSTILDEAALIVNSHPIGITLCRKGDLEISGLITPLHLMLGRLMVRYRTGG